MGRRPDEIKWRFIYGIDNDSVERKDGGSESMIVCGHGK